MNLQEYQKQAMRTCPNLGNVAIDLAHMVLGIQSEVAELIDAIFKEDEVNIKEEIADQFWYIANYCNIRAYDLQSLWNDKADVYKLEEAEELADGTIIHVYPLSILQDLVKKKLAYNKDINVIKEAEAIRGLLYALSLIVDELEMDLEQSLQNNIDKLRVRFPDKFDEEKANTRNLEAERKELEKV